MRKIIFGGLLASTMLVPAFAQNSPPAATAPAAKPSTSATVTPAAHGDMWRASKLIGLNVYNDQNEKLGDISEVLLDKSGKVDGVVIGVGGFLGMGKHDIMVQMDKLKFVNEPVRTTSTTSTTTTTTGSAARPAPSPSTTTSTSSTKSKWYPDHAVLSGATKESLKSMAEFKFD
jgi:sporulation protein YlmC with PRC-barrel domain